MSVKLMSIVWDSDLPSDEKFVALALADWADDEGGSIHPSQARIAWKVGKSPRAVRDTLTKLIERGVFVKIAGAGGGRGVTVHYRLIAAALPGRPAYGPVKSAESSVFVNPAADAAKPGSLRQKTRKPTADDPSGDPPSDPSELTTRARENPRGPQIKAAIEAHETDAKRVQAIRDRLHLAMKRRGTQSQKSTIGALVRRGLTDEDVDYSIKVANEEARDDSIAYAIGVMRECIKRRDEGVEPHERRTQNRGGGRGRSLLRGGAGARPGSRSLATGTDDRRGAPAALPTGKPEGRRID